MSTNDKKSDESNQGKKLEEFPIQEYRLVPADQIEGGREDDEIDLIELIKTIWDSRKTIYKFVGVGFVLGILVALLSPKEYVSSATLMPEYSTEGQGGASSLLQQYGGLLGISGGGSYSANSNAIRVDLYPKIVSSLTFQDKLARETFYFPDYDTTTSMYSYLMEIKTPGFFGYIQKYTIGLPSIIFSNDRQKRSSGDLKDGIVELSKEEMLVIENLRKRITANLDEESGIISVSAKVGNPKLAAEVAKYTIEELTVYLTEYRIEKVTRDLEFVKEKLDAAKERFTQAQLTKAEYEDSNLGNQTAKADLQRQNLNAEYDLALNLYNTLTQRYEEAKIKVQEETPVFKVLQPVQVPVDDDTSGAIILIVFVLLSGMLSIGYIFLSQFLSSIKFH